VQKFIWILEKGKHLNTPELAGFKGNTHKNLKKHKNFEPKLKISTRCGFLQFSILAIIHRIFV